MGCRRGPPDLGVVLGLHEGLALRPSHPHADQHGAPAMAVSLLGPLKGVPGAQVLLERHPERHVGIIQIRVERAEGDLRAFLHARLELHGNSRTSQMRWPGCGGRSYRRRRY